MAVRFWTNLLFILRSSSSDLWGFVFLDFFRLKSSSFSESLMLSVDSSDVNSSLKFVTIKLKKRVCCLFRNQKYSTALILFYYCYSFYTEIFIYFLFDWILLLLLLVVYTLLHIYKHFILNVSLHASKMYTCKIRWKLEIEWTQINLDIIQSCLSIISFEKFFKSKILCCLINFDLMK